MPAQRGALTKGLCDFGMIRCAWGSHAVLTRSVSHEQLLCCSKLLSEFSQWIKPGISGLEKRFCLESASLAPSSPFSCAGEAENASPPFPPLSFGLY